MSINHGWSPRRKKDKHWVLWVLLAVMFGFAALAIIGKNMFERDLTKLQNDRRAVEMLPIPVPHAEPETLEPLSGLPREGKIRNRAGNDVVYRVFEVEGMPCIWVWKTGMSCDWRRFNAKTKEEGADR